MPIFVPVAVGFWTALNPFTPKSDQCQISPAASPEIDNHTVWRTWRFIAYSDERWWYDQFSLHFSLKGWENVLIELGSERFNGFFDLQQGARQPVICRSFPGCPGNKAAETLFCSPVYRAHSSRSKRKAVRSSSDFDRVRIGASAKIRARGMGWRRKKLLLLPHFLPVQKLLRPRTALRFARKRLLPRSEVPGDNALGTRLTPPPSDEGLALETSATVSFTASITLINTQLIRQFVSPTQLPSSGITLHPPFPLNYPPRSVFSKSACCVSRAPGVDARKTTESRYKSCGPMFE